MPSLRKRVDARASGGGGGDDDDTTYKQAVRKELGGDPGILPQVPALNDWRLTFDALAQWPRDPSGTFAAGDKAAEQQSGSNAEPGIRLQAWLEAASDLGLVDVITAEPIFNMLAAQGQSTISAERFKRYTVRLVEKDNKTANRWSAFTAARKALAAAGVPEESVLLTGGAPAYTIHETNATVRVGATLVLTESAMWFRPITFGLLRSNKLQRFDLDGSDPALSIEAAKGGPMGSELFDNAINLTRHVDGSPYRDERAACKFIFAPPSGKKHRNMWLACIREVVAAHAFAKRFGFSDDKDILAAIMRMSRAAILRLHAARDGPLDEQESALPCTVAQVDPTIDASLAAMFRSSFAASAPEHEHEHASVQPEPEPLPLGRTCSTPLPSEPQPEASTTNTAEKATQLAETTQLEEAEATRTVSAGGGDGSRAAPTPTTSSSLAAQGAHKQLRAVMAEQRKVRKQEEKVQASLDAAKFDSLPAKIELIKVLVATSPFARGLANCVAVLRWDNPLLSIFVAIVLIHLAWKQWLCFLPSLVCGCICMDIMNTRFKHHGAARLDFEYETQGMASKLQKLQQLLHGIEKLIGSMTTFFLKIHALYSSEHVDSTNQFIKVFAISGVLFGVVLCVYGWTRPWSDIVLIVGLFAVRCPLRPHLPSSSASQPGGAQGQGDSAKQPGKASPLAEWWRMLPAIEVHGRRKQS